jgi:hypothetical protein
MMMTFSSISGVAIRKSCEKMNKMQSITLAILDVRINGIVFDVRFLCPHQIILTIPKNPPTCST